MLNVCEILHKSEIFKPPYPNRKTWPFDLIQYPISSTESEVEPRYEKLKIDLVKLKRKLERNPHYKDTVRARFAVGLLRRTVSGNNSSNFVLFDDDDDDDDDGVDEGKAADDDGDSAEEEEGSDDTFAVGRLPQTMAVYNPCKLVLSDYYNDDAVDEGKAADDNCDAAEEEDGYDDMFAARSPEFRKLCKHIFTALPQQPHFSPLSKYCVSVRRQMRLGIDVVFVKLTSKLQNLGGDKIISHEEEGTIREELSDLEEMGYDVIKLRERFGLLMKMKALAKEEESYEEKRKNLEGKIKAEMVQLEKVQSRISALKIENEVVIDQHCSFGWKMSCLKSALDKGDLYNRVKMEAKDYRGNF